MQKFVITGGKRLNGEIELQGCKNSALPIMAAAVLVNGKCILESCPNLTDVYSASRILNSIGCKCSIAGNTAEIDSVSVSGNAISEKLMGEMRSSIMFVGAILGRVGQCTFSIPGGCELGPRPIDMHLAAFAKLGAEISENGGEITCRMPKEKRHGGKISLPFPSVGATENIILCSVLAEGETVVNNAAREPEICDMCRFLRSCGAKIKGDGESRIVIEGVERLHGCEYRIMPDRIAGATYLAMTAAAGGAMILKNACICEMEPFLSVLEQSGCYICTADNRIYLRRGGRLRAVRDRIRTMPHPGFPTDAQAVLMAALAAADGTTVFEENIFDCRYRHTDALIKMGADIQVMGKAAVVRGVKKLHGADVEATDLRGGAAMAVAALGAEGRTTIGCISHIGRGYEKFEENITSLGGRISRE
ncbi:MAG: UDP-N-acetylglucosamine 1-carboxyvinyltransferase [Ruminococcus sp.]|jgi:UDP-N-acetylglucosamine 1-carboxyvinyltransferase|nr:UDP-N-acetylglucosamine 1-carboxyvinyltransferase [Ruminococcus sp.]